MKRSTPVEPVPGCFDFYVVNTFGLIALPTLLYALSLKSQEVSNLFFYHVTSEFFMLYKALPLVYTES